MLIKLNETLYLFLTDLKSNFPQAIPVSQLYVRNYCFRHVCKPIVETFFLGKYSRTLCYGLMYQKVHPQYVGVPQMKHNPAYCYRCIIHIAIWLLCVYQQLTTLRRRASYLYLNVEHELYHVLYKIKIISRVLNMKQLPAYKH